jgi:hypothetical protein
MIELLLVVSLLCVLLSLLSAAYSRAKRISRVTQEAVSLKHKYDDALIRGAIKPRDYEFYLKQFQRQYKAGLEQTK